MYDPDGFSNETLKNSCIEIFNTYLQCRLAPPDGTRYENNLFVYLIKRMLSKAIVAHWHSVRL